MATLIRWGHRYTKTGRQRTLEFIIAGIPARVMWNPLFDKRGTGSRAVFGVSFDRKGYHYGLLFQHYREGYVFDKHTDGVPENLVISILLHKPKSGGVFSSAGPVKSWLRGRIKYFDGGRYDHEVSEIIKGSRTVLMLQRGRWRL